MSDDGAANLGASMPLDLDELLSHQDWIYDLARRIVGDAQLADEVTQQTLIAALDKPPRQAGALRSWLATVARNFAFRQRRDRETRRKYEQRWQRPTSDEAPDLVECAEEQHRVVGAVLTLDEPFRATILEHFFAGRTPIQIARRLGVPSATVRSRLKRGLDQLRAKLRRSDDDSWPPALLALATMGPSGTALFGSRGLAAAAIVLLVIGGLWFFDFFGTDDSPPYVATPEPPLASADVTTPEPTKPTPMAVEPRPEPPTVAAERSEPEPTVEEATPLPEYFRVRVDVAVPESSPSGTWEIVESEIWVEGCEYDRDWIGFLPPTIVTGDPLLLPGEFRRTEGTTRIAVLLRIERTDVDRHGTHVFWAAQQRIKPEELTDEPVDLRRSKSVTDFTLRLPKSRSKNRVPRSVTLHVAEVTASSRWPAISTTPTPRGWQGLQPPPVDARLLVLESGTDRKIRIVGLPAQWALIDDLVAGDIAREYPAESRPRYRLDRRAKSKEVAVWQGIEVGCFGLAALKSTRLARVEYPGFRWRESGGKLPDGTTVVLRRRKKSEPMAWAERRDGAWHWVGSPPERFSSDRLRYSFQLPGHSAVEVLGRAQDEWIEVDRPPASESSWTMRGTVLSTHSRRLPLIVSAVPRNDAVRRIRRVWTDKNGMFVISGWPEILRQSVRIEVDRIALHQNIMMTKLGATDTRIFTRSARPDQRLDPSLHTIEVTAPLRVDTWVGTEWGWESWSGE